MKEKGEKKHVYVEKKNIQLTDWSTPETCTREREKKLKYMLILLHVHTNGKKMLVWLHVRSQKK